MNILYAGYNEGLVPNAEVVFRALSSIGDYHGEMNNKMIIRWLEDKLVPNLPSKCVLVVDNAAHHNVQVDRRPVRVTKKHLIQEWLTKHGALWSAGMLKDELLELCKTHPHKSVYVSRLPLNKDKRTHPGSHAVYNNKALVRLHWSRQGYRGELLGERCLNLWL